MRITSVNTYKQPYFKGAAISINALSDIHGEISLANHALEEIRENKSDIFCPQRKGCKNILSICGDWFMDGAKKGYFTKPNKENGYFQLEIFNKFVNEIKKMAPDNTTLFTPGNHEFDGGVELLADILSKLDANIIMSNLQPNSSHTFKQLIDGNKLVSEKIIEVDDDKSDELKHKVLFLGISPVNLVSYQKDLNGVSLIENVKKSQASVKPEDYKKTFEYCKQRIQLFKDENPKGLVVLMSHTGVGFVDNLAKETDITLAFDGHEHKENMRIINGTPIIPLSQNFKKIINTKLEIDDSGQLSGINIRELFPLENKKKGILSKFFEQLFSEDIKDIYTLRTDNPKLKTLNTQNIRDGNNYLANFVTDCILAELQKKDDSIDIFALISSSIKHPLKISEKASISPFDIMNILCSVDGEAGEIMTTVVNGEELAYLVLDNILCNTRNKTPLMQYSGLIVDKTKILEDVSKGKQAIDIIPHIKDAKTGKAIVPNKNYKIANLRKYFKKSTDKRIKELINQSEYTGYNAQDLLKNHFSSSNGELYTELEDRIL